MTKSNIQQVNARLCVIEEKLDMIEKVIHAAFVANKTFAAATVFQALLKLPSFKSFVDNAFGNPEKHPKPKSKKL